MPGANLQIRITASDSASPIFKGLGGAVRGLGSVLGSPIRAAGALTNALGKIGLAALGIKAVASAAAGLGEALGVGLASDVNESMNKVNVLFGKSAGVIEAFSKTSANSFGMSTAAALAAAGTYGNLFRTMGLGEKAAANLSVDLLKTAADLGSFNNVGTEEVLEKIRAGLVGEAEPLRALGINLSEVTVEAKGFAMGLGHMELKGKKWVKVLSMQDKLTARAALIMDQAKTAANDFANTSGGMANAQKRISAGFENMRLAIGQRLLPVIAPLIAGLADALPGALATVTPLLDTFGKIVLGVADVFGGKGWQNLTAALTGAFGPEVAFGIRVVVEQIGLLVDAVKTAISTGDFSKLWTQLSNIGTGLFNTIKTAVSKIDWGGIWGKVTSIGSSLIAKLPGIAGDVLTWISTQFAAVDWGAVWTTVKATIGSALTTAVDIGSSVLTWVKWQWMAIDWPAVWTSVKSAVGSAITTALDIGSSVLAWIKGVWGDINWGEVWKTASGVGQGIIDAAIDISGKLTEWLRQQAGKIDWKLVWADAQGPEGVPDLKTDKSVWEKNFPFSTWLLGEIGKLAIELPNVMNKLAESIRSSDAFATAAASMVKTLMDSIGMSLGGKGTFGESLIKSAGVILSWAWTSITSDVNVIAALVEGAAKIVIRLLDEINIKLTGASAGQHIAASMGIAITNGTAGASSSAYTGGLSVGQSMDQGMAAGIRNNASLVTWAARYVAQNAINGARDVLQERSPSKVFMDIGQNMTKGMAVGMTQAAPTLVGASRSVAAVAPRMAMQAAPAYAASSSGRGGPSITIVVQGNTLLGDDRSMARKLVEIIRPELDAQVRWR